MANTEIVAGFKEALHNLKEAVDLSQGSPYIEEVRRAIAFTGKLIELTAHKLNSKEVLDLSRTFISTLFVAYNGDKAAWDELCTGDPGFRLIVTRELFPIAMSGSTPAHLHAQ